MQRGNTSATVRMPDEFQFGTTACAYTSVLSANHIVQCGVCQCPQCARRFKHKDIINIYAPEVVVRNKDFEKVGCDSSICLYILFGHGLNIVAFLQQLLEKVESLEEVVSNFLCHL